MKSYTVQDLQVLHDVIGDFFEANNPSQAYHLMAIYDSIALELGLPNWHGDK